MPALTTQARFKCPSCKADVEAVAVVPEPHWGAGDNVSEWTAEDQTDVQCPACHVEFPAFVSNGASGCHITFDDHPMVEIDANNAFYSPADDDIPDDWVPDDYEPPENPFRTFKISHDQALELLTSNGGDGSHLINRMVFAHMISALEAFLGDTFIRTVMIDEVKKRKLLDFDEHLKKDKYTLADIAADGEFVNTQIRKHLRSIIYHNIAKVSVLYKGVLGMDIFKILGSDKDVLFKAINYRHDCVHRNGYDKEGNKLNVFTKEYVAKVADIAHSLAFSLDMNVTLGKDFFEEFSPKRDCLQPIRNCFFGRAGKPAPKSLSFGLQSSRPDSRFLICSLPRMALSLHIHTTGKVAEPRAYAVYAGGLCIGLLRQRGRYESDRSGHWDWFINGVTMDVEGMARCGVSDNLENAKKDVRANWNPWLAWTGLQEADQPADWGEPASRAFG
jgi:hypothetical protein